jgi:hypothetical protein
MPAIVKGRPDQTEPCRNVAEEREGEEAKREGKGWGQFDVRDRSCAKVV